MLLLFTMRRHALLDTLIMLIRHHCSAYYAMCRYFALLMLILRACYAALLTLPRFLMLPLLRALPLCHYYFRDAAYAPLRHIDTRLPLSLTPFAIAVAFSLLTPYVFSHADTPCHAAYYILRHCHAAYCYFHAYA